MTHWRALRYRWPRLNAISFEKWHYLIKSTLKLNDLGVNPFGSIVRPMLTSGMTEVHQGDDEPSLREITLLYSSSDSNEIASWKNQIIHFLKELPNAS